MSRVITSVSFGLHMDVRSTPPVVGVTFTNIDLRGSETHGHTVITDSAAQAVWEADDMLVAVNLEIDAQESAAMEPGVIADRVTAVSDAKELLRTLEAEAAELDRRIAAKQAELAGP